MSYQKEKALLQELAKEVADIAALPLQEEKRKLWRGLNDLQPQRPMVMIDQICWNEIDCDGTLALHCQTPELRPYEEDLRRKLFQWKHFPVDMVIEPYIKVPKAIRNSGYGLNKQEKTLAHDPKNDVLSRKYIDILQNDQDLEKITVPSVSLDEPETAKRLDVAHGLFDGILGVHSAGAELFLQLWDPISTYKGMENALYALADDPDFMHRVVTKMMLSFTSMLDQLEEQGLLCDARYQTLVHCAGAYTNRLPAPGYDPQRPRCKDLWIPGLAQMFSAVSAAMHQEFELDYVNPIFKRFGLVYYGCCEPLDQKLDIVTQIPNLRKVSMSPWTQAARGAEGLGNKFVFSSKPNPAYLAHGAFDEELIRNELHQIKAACDQHGCPLEFILKDISTVQYEPQRLFRWAEIAMETAMA
ncbi:MAG: hypothetical protein FWD25_02150 [Clostridia bacterium]|nr:hypothetical protein [Clostridia bacterium]